MEKQPCNVTTIWSEREGRERSSWVGLTWSEREGRKREELMGRPNGIHDA
jgi:hypothetical protein